MCNFVPGECLALVSASPCEINERLSSWQLPGHVNVLPLLSGEGPFQEESAQPFREHYLVHVNDIPEGLEVLAVSKLSAALAQWVGEHRAVVELDMRLPLAAHAAQRHVAELNPRARRTAELLRQFMQRTLNPTTTRRPVGLLDSGLALSELPHGRRFTAHDYTGAPAMLGQLLVDDHDQRGHGTQVCRILDSALPEKVPIVSGRVVRQNDIDITVMRVAQAFANLVAAENPAVVNLSLAPRDDAAVCPHCGEVVPAEAFHSLILPEVFRSVRDCTLTVMAAGNRGRLGNARHALAHMDSLALVEAEDGEGRLAAYSNRVDSEFAAVARHFGGDAESRRNGGTVFDGVAGSYGTSFAAPFVAAAAYAYEAEYGSSARFGIPAAAVPAFGTYCAHRLRVPINFKPAPAAAPG
jgi:hypothetical protein